MIFDHFSFQSFKHLKYFPCLNRFIFYTQPFSMWIYSELEPLKWFFFLFLLLNIINTNKNTIKANENCLESHLIGIQMWNQGEILRTKNCFHFFLSLSHSLFSWFQFNVNGVLCVPLHTAHCTLAYRKIMFILREKETI